MNKKEKQRFDELDERHLKLLKNNGMQPKTIEAYRRGVRRVMMRVDCVPDKLTVEQLRIGFINNCEKFI